MYIKMPKLLVNTSLLYDQINPPTYRKSIFSKLKDYIYRVLNTEPQFDSFLDENGVFIWEKSNTHNTEDEDIFSNYAYENCGYYEN